MLTLYYVGATFLQSWRIKNVCYKIAEHLAQPASVSFYTLPADTDDGYDVSLATSELCINRNTAKVSHILWLRANQRGCCLLPMQSIHIMPWITFPKSASLIPFEHAESPEHLVAYLSEKKELMHLLLEADIQPSRNYPCDVNIVKIEDYGKLIAWKIDSHLAVLIETDVEHFTKFLITTYLQNNCLINDQLPLIRIESVNYEGKPQPFEMLGSHLRKPTRTKEHLDADEWNKHLADLRSISVLASQATEYAFNKNRTEGKSGVIKPDLIPHDKKLTEDVVTKAAVTSVDAKRKDAEATDGEVPPQVKSTDVKLPIENEKLDTVKQTKVQITETSHVTSYSNTASPVHVGRMKAKPTEIKKPGVSLKDGRFKATIVPESCEKSLSTTTMQPTTSSQSKKSSPKSASKSSELENIAAATVALQKQQRLSPLHTSTVSSSSSTSSSNLYNTVPSTSASKATAAVAAAAATTQQLPIANIIEASTSTSLPIVSVKATTISVNEDNIKRRPSLKRSKDITTKDDNKPLNILIYSDSGSAKENVAATLKDILEDDLYTIYPLTMQQLEQKQWLDNTALVVVCGAVAPNIGEILVNYFLHGGKVLSLCSDILHFILPTYRTAEVREHELVQFSYDKWQKVKMMHHIFCYQPSPVKKNFSTDSDDMSTARKSALVCPRSIELKDLDGEVHNLDVKVLGMEETWHTPSLLLANSIESDGKAVFSQVHLETKPSQFEDDEVKYSILKQNDDIRREIFADLLSKYLGVNVKSQTVADVSPTTSSKCIYKNAYFLGRHESKFDLLEKLKALSNKDSVIVTSKLTMKFCTSTNDKCPSANTNVLPILIHSCPEDFSTVEYFDDLKTNYIGRLVIYAPIVGSSMSVIDELELTNGIAVLARQQTDGVGRSNNQWLSPLGCAMFSIQLHISLQSELGSRLPLIQHIVGAAIVNALKGHHIYKKLDISLKWPNDIYTNGVTKIGGLIVKTTIYGTNAIVNIGCGVNLDNSKPTTCINQMIRECNRLDPQQDIPLLKYEAFIAMIFNEIEKLIENVQSGDFDSFYKLYYSLWLHNEQIISICDKDGKKKNASVIGLDDYGYLKVKLSSGDVETVQPDGNSFDMLKGLIVPKFN